MSAIEEEHGDSVMYLSSPGVVRKDSAAGVG